MNHQSIVKVAEIERDPDQPRKLFVRRKAIELGEALKFW